MALQNPVSPEASFAPHSRVQQRSSRRAATAPKSRPFPLLSLPAVVLENVCASLCGHCPEPEPICPKTQKSSISEDWCASFTSLNALSKTCSSLRGVAQTHLFHRPGGLDRVDLFVRTLLERPDLGHLIKNLDLSVLCNEKNQAYWRRAYRMLASEQQQIDAQRLKSIEHTHLMSRVIKAFILARCPNIEELMISMTEYEGGPSLHHLIHGEQNNLRIGQMPRLRTLKVCKLIGFTGIWYVPERYPFSHPVVLELLRRAPNVTFLEVGEACSGEADMIKNIEPMGDALRNLTHLSIRECNEAIVLNKMGRKTCILDRVLRHCRNLKRFTLEPELWGWGDFLESHNWDDTDWLQALKPSCRTLKYMEIRPRGPYHQIQHAFNPLHLPKFTALETLYVNSVFWGQTTNDSSAAKGIQFTELFTPTLKRLIVDTNYSSSVFEWAARVAKEWHLAYRRFPAFEELVLVIPPHANSDKDAAYKMKLLDEINDGFSNILVDFTSYVPVASRRKLFRIKIEGAEPDQISRIPQPQ